MVTFPPQFKSNWHCELWAGPSSVSESCVCVCDAYTHNTCEYTHPLSLSLSPFLSLFHSVTHTHTCLHDMYASADICESMQSQPPTPPPYKINVPAVLLRISRAIAIPCFRHRVCPPVYE